MTRNLWEYLLLIYDFIINVYATFEKVWTFTFTIGDWTFTFPEMLTTLCIVLLIAMFIKKFIPVA